MAARGVEVVVPEVADYEVRRELTRINAVGSLRRLDDLVTLGGLSYQPARAPLGAKPHSFGPMPASLASQPHRPDALDADVILAACAATIGHPGDQVLVATQNVGHLARYCDARLWTTIV